MRSPRRAPLRPRNGRALIQDQAYVEQKEKERRRLLRIQQVRLMSAEAARKLRQRTRREQLRFVEKIANEELEKYRQRKLKELAALEAEYQSALQDIGLGHEGLAEQRAYEKWLEDQAIQRREVALVRGGHALNVVQHKQMLEQRIKEEKVQLKKSTRLAEDARAAEVRARKLKPRPKSLSFGQVIEVDLNKEESEGDGKTVRFQGEPSLVPDRTWVRRIGKDAIPDRPGVEEAIQEEEKRRRDEEDDPKSAATARSLAAMKRSRTARDSHRYFTEDSFLDDSSHSETQSPFQATISRYRLGQDDVDLVPSRGPSTSGTPSTPSLHAEITRYPTGEFGLPIMGGPSSAFTTSAGTGPEGRKSMSLQGGPTATTQTKTGSDKAVVRSGSEDDKKAAATKEDKDFIAKVLQGLGTLDEGEDEVHVDVNVEEVSTLATSSRATSSLREEISRLLPPTPSSSSSDITKEKFISSAWQTEDIKGLIGSLKKGQPSKTEQVQQQAQLRSYIEQLLSMKRQEIADLSVTTTSMEESTSTPSTSTYEGSKSSSSGDFVSSTPASNGSKSSLGSNKVVRFQSEDVWDSSHIMPSSKLAAERKKQEIIEQTKQSLEEIQSYYQEQRRLIEEELERRKKRKEKENQDPLSEGPLLSTSSSSSIKVSDDAKKSPSRSESSSKETSSGNGSRRRLEQPKKKVMTRRSSQTKGSLQLSKLNKSSSSGTTTTSGSVATAELLARLQQLQIPSLERPPPDLTLVTERPHQPRQPIEEEGLIEETEDLNTSADLQKAPELEHESGLKRQEKQMLEQSTTFRFSSDEDAEAEADVSKEPRMSHISMSSSET